MRSKQSLSEELQHGGRLSRSIYKLQDVIMTKRIIGLQWNQTGYTSAWNDDRMWLCSKEPFIHITTEDAAPYSHVKTTQVNYSHTQSDGHHNKLNVLDLSRLCIRDSFIPTYRVLPGWAPDPSLPWARQSGSRHEQADRNRQIRLMIKILASTKIQLIDRTHTKLRWAFC